MPGPVTAHYGWQMPLLGGDPTVWGAEINTTIGQIDGQVWANQQAIAAGGSSVGDMKMFAGATPPAGWALCNGAAQSTTGAYAALFAVIGYVYGGSSGTFNLPNATNRMLIGAGGLYALGSTGGEATHVLTTAELPAHAHPITDVPHTHTATQAAHTHTDVGHVHSASATESAHAHGSSLVKYIGGGSGTVGVTGGPLNATVGNTDAATAGVTVTIGTGFAALGTAQPAITVAATTPGLATTQNNTGGGGAHNNLPPYLAVNMIIRYN
jgi:microcystin-dependent protein